MGPTQAIIYLLDLFKSRPLASCSQESAGESTHSGCIEKIYIAFQIQGDVGTVLHDMFAQISNEIFFCCCSAAREIAWLEKEERARQYYEKHLEERRKKLEEQRLKEERRRAAVEEKRRLRIEEDKERHEAVVRRTIERSQKQRQKQNRWSWGGTLHSSSGINNTDPDRRSVSTMNLSKHVDPVINKRLSSSSATLLNSPDRGTVKKATEKERA
uniref:Microtubule associated protein 7 n=1 Tax=Varanus komodoensis TaxID=61221 RepID=A0A8D2JBS2_VARKO